MTAIMYDSNYCCYCGKPFSLELVRTVEHLVPQSKGGNNTSYNKRYCCRRCNHDRGNKSLEMWKAELLIRLSAAGPSWAYDLKITIENIEYWQYYIKTAGDKLRK